MMHDELALSVAMQVLPCAISHVQRSTFYFSCRAVALILRAACGFTRDASRYAVIVRSALEGQDNTTSSGNFCLLDLKRQLPAM